MASGNHGAALRQIHRVFDQGTLAGLSEGQLLERFITRLDEAAFEAILARYGPMVLGVCRRFLRHSHDIEDAFQATFLILVRRAKSLRDRELLGHWLYGVAYRVSVRARAQAALRRVREGSAVEDIPVASDPSRVSDWQEWNPLLDAEINRLPERFRAPIVLCLIEDRTHEEAARALGWPVGTVKSRLARGRERLRSRLARLGLAPSAALLGFAVSPDPVRGSVSPALAHSTLQAVRRFAASRAVIWTTSAGTLARGVLRSLVLTKLAGTAIFVLTITVAVLATAGMIRVTPSSEQTGAPHEVIAAGPVDPTAPLRSEARTLDFRVIARKSRQPVSGASVFLDHRGSRCITDAAGRCTIALPKNVPTRGGFTIWVWKDGFAPVSIRCTGYDLIDETFTNYTAELDPAGAMGGTVQDEQGHPITGANLRIWLRQTSAQPRNLRESVDIGVSDPITTDAHGRWRLAMLPSSFTDSDLLSIELSHPDYVSDVGQPMRPNPAIKDLRTQSSVLVMTKGFLVRGRVLDPEGKAVEGAPVILAWKPANRFVRYTGRTDAAGRFAFEHARPGEQALCIQADRFAPALTEIDVGPELKTLTIRLQPGRAVQGRVVDKQGQPVAGIGLGVAEWRSREILDWQTKTDDQGRFHWDHAPTDQLTLSVGWQEGQKSVLAGTNPTRVEIVAKRPLKLQGAIIDAVTGRPVSRARVIPGLIGVSTDILRPRLPDGRERPQWQYTDARVFLDGHYEIDFGDYQYVRTGLPFLRVEAEGYAPAISRAYPAEGGRQTWDVRLEPGHGVSGTVRLPDGAPAGGADVIFVTPSEEATIRNGRFDPRRSHADRLPTGRDGHFWFARPDEPFLVIMLSDRGFAIRSVEELAASRDVTLQPWRRIEGILRNGSRPGMDEEVAGFAPFAGAAVSRLTFYYDAKTDDHGRFVLDRVIPGGLTLSQRVGFPDGMVPNSHLAYVEARAGETVSVTVGSTGRPLVGRLLLPGNAGPLVGFATGWGMMTRELPPPYPKELLTWEPARKFAWWGEFRQTKAGRAYFRQQRIYSALVADDGTFRIENVEPGSYELNLTVPRIQIGGQGRVWDILSGNARRVVDVPEIPGGRTDDPLDLGRIALTITTNHTLEVGAMAPPFAIKTLDGKPIRLLAYRGKYVLLDFWATWCGPCLLEMPHLKDVYDTFGSDPRFALIGLSLDEDADTLRQYVTAKGLKWAQGHLHSGTLAADYGVKSIPQIILIGPDGKVIARDLGGERIKEAVAKALGRGPNGARSD